MAWNIVKNEPMFKDEKYIGRCPRFNKDAIVTGHYRGSKWAKTDLQLTYQLSGYNCNLLTDTYEDGFCSYTNSGKSPFTPPKYL